MSTKSIDTETSSDKEKPKKTAYHVLNFRFTIKVDQEADKAKELWDLSLKIQDSMQKTCDENGFFISFMNLDYNNPKDLP